MEIWIRGTALAGVVLVWIVFRVALGKPIRHPWLTAMLCAVVSTGLGEASEHGPPGHEHLFYGLASFAGFLTLFAFAEGLRRESGAAPAGRRVAAAAAAAAALLALGCAWLPPPRDRIVAETLGASFLLISLPPLLVAQRRRAGSLTIAAGIIVYALGRTVLALGNVRGADVLALARAADAAAIVTLGAGIVVFAAQTARELSSGRKPCRAVGGDPTLA